MFPKTLAALCLALTFEILPPAPAPAADKIPLLLITGENSSHDWKATTTAIRDLLVSTGRFDVTVAECPDAKADPETWGKFHPDFSPYKVVVSNYKTAEWPKPVCESFQKYVSDGGGLVIYHAANGSFPKWDEFYKMIGLGWRPATSGARLALDAASQPVRIPAGQGDGAGHGPRHPFEVVVRDAGHPIMRGLPSHWLHVQDELYQNQRGPIGELHLLATAYADPQFKGTGMNEPMVYTLPYGRGRVFVSLLGHDVPATIAPDSATLLARGSEWAATGEVTLPVATDFPGPEARPPSAAKSP